MKFKSLAAGAAVAVLASIAMGGAAGAVVITNGAYSVGISEYGQLLHSTDGGATGVGFRRDSDGADAIFSGAPRDSWGVNDAYADEFGGNDGLLTSSLSSAAASAVSTVTTADFSIVQSFSFVADNILAIDVALTNISDDALNAVFQRLAEFHVDENGVEYETNPYSTGLQTTIWGGDSQFTSGDWFVPCCISDPFDGGAGFRLKLGTMAAGQTRSFTYYYGLGDSGVADQMNALGVTDVMLVANQGGSAAAALGVSIAPVPEPAAWAMMLLGFFGLGSTLRRRKAARA
jgi:hypothetical protein